MTRKQGDGELQSYHGVYQVIMTISSLHSSNNPDNPTCATAEQTITVSGHIAYNLIIALHISEVVQRHTCWEHIVLNHLINDPTIHIVVSKELVNRGF